MLVQWFVVVEHAFPGSYESWLKGQEGGGGVQKYLVDTLADQ